MKKILLPAAATFALAFIFLGLFTATAHAANNVAGSDGSLIDLLQPVLAAFESGSYLYAGSLALVLAVALARRYGEPQYPWLGTKAGSAILTLVGSFGASMSAALMGDGSFSWLMVWHSLEIAFGAAGGYALVKALVVEPYLVRLADKGPAWLHSPMHLILWIFQETGKAPTATQQATKAIEAINRPDIDVTVAVTTAEGTAVATSPASVTPPITVVTSDVAIPRTVTK